VAIDPADPTAGFVPFVIEVKNVRQTLYPEHREIWDLLWKAGHYPDHLPLLIAPRFHHTTFVLFSAIGAIAVPTIRQWFAPDPAIATRRFQTVTRSLAIGHAAQLNEPDKPSPALIDFFTKTLHKATRRHPDRSLLAASRELWQRAAPICAQPAFSKLREQLPPTHRPVLYQQLLEELYAEGLEVEDLLPLHFVEE
jgi:hypothetical protein